MKVQNVSECLSGWYYLSHRTFCYQGQSHREGSYSIKIWLFLLYYLNRWFLGNQTWSDDTSSEARVSYEKNVLLHSGSRSQWRVKMLMFVQISSKPPNILFPNLILWCIIMSHSVVQKGWFAIFKVKVTAKAHMIKYDNFYYIFWTADPFPTKLCLIEQCYKSRVFYGEIGLLYSRSRSQQNFKMSMNVLSG